MRSPITDAFIEKEAKKEFPYQKQFADFAISVHEGVYPPSEDSLVLIKALEQFGQPNSVSKGLDFGTGTGVFALAMARMGMSVIAIDVNANAVQCAGVNAQANQLQSSIDFRHGNGLAVLSADEKFDVVVASLPFESFAANNDFERSVYDEGFGVRKAFFNDIKSHLNPGGKIFYAYADYAEQQAPLATFLAGYSYKMIFEQQSADGEMNQVYLIEPST